MKALRGGIPRALRNHRTADGWQFRVYCRAKLDRLGPLPRDAVPILREAALVNLELQAMHLELDRRLTRRERSRLRRQTVIYRSQLLVLERRLEELAGRNGTPDLARAIQQAQAQAAAEGTP